MQLLLFITCYYLQLCQSLADSDISILYIISKVFVGPNIDCCEGLGESLQLDNFVQQSLLNCDMIEVFVRVGVLYNIRS